MSIACGGEAAPLRMVMMGNWSASCRMAAVRVPLQASSFQ